MTFKALTVNTLSYVGSLGLWRNFKGMTELGVRYERNRADRAFPPIPPRTWEIEKTNIPLLTHSVG